ncbi:MAG: hypothetical protein GTO18_22075 [Anaerolineales bacterium]|nr:hypothetical protein [Anaerolineales bacterium]
MHTPRRLYIYAVSIVSLQAVAWAVISLLRNLIISGLDPNVEALAFQIAIILIGLPVYIVHWLWGQRLAHRDVDERGSTIRRLYLYGMETIFLASFVNSAFQLLSTIFALPSGDAPNMMWRDFSAADAIAYDLIALVILGFLWFYHQRVLADDAKVIPETGGSATVRRLYIYIFCAAGLAMTTTTLIELLRWLMFQIDAGDAIRTQRGWELSREVARLIIGLPLWVIFWRWAQRLFLKGGDEERDSALRKFYQYAIVFLAAISAVTSATFILAGFFRRVLAVSGGVGEGDIRTPLSIILIMIALWVYHTYVLREDAQLAEEAPRQARIRRIYWYLTAAIGLCAFLVGLSGDISVLIRSLEEASFGTGLKEQLAWYTAALLAGLPVWIIPWYQAQKRAASTEEEGAEERRSVVRRIYIYFFLFVATMTILSSVIFIVFQILSVLLGEPAPSFSELVQPIAFSIVTALVWIYHWWVLREDRQRSIEDEEERLEEFRLVVVDVGDGSFARTVIAELERALPGLSPTALVLTQSETDDAEEREDPSIAISQAHVILGPWETKVVGGAGGVVGPELVESISISEAKKLLIPTRSDEWEWVGVERWDRQAIVHQSVNAVKQVAAGEAVKLVKPLGAGAIIGIIIAAIILLFVIAIPLISFLAFSLMGF